MPADLDRAASDSDPRPEMYTVDGSLSLPTRVPTETAAATVCATAPQFRFRAGRHTKPAGVRVAVRVARMRWRRAKQMGVAAADCSPYGANAPGDEYS